MSAIAQQILLTMGNVVIVMEQASDFKATSTLSAATRQRLAASAILAGNAALSAEAKQRWAAVALLAGSSAIIANAARYTTVTATLAASSTLLANTLARLAGTTILAGNADLSVSARMALRGSAILAGSATLRLAVWSVEKTYTLNTDAAGEQNNSYRVIVPALSKNIQKIRVTVTAVAVGTTAVDNMSVGIRSGTTDDCTAVPTEITFGAASGFSISTGATLLSDEISFAASAGDQLLIPIDIAAANGNIRYNSTGGFAYRATAANTYNTASATMTLGGGGIEQVIVSQVEVFG